MSRVVASFAASSAEDGAGTEALASGVNVLMDDLIVAQVASSLNGGTGANIATPAGWALHRVDTDRELRTYVFYRRVASDGEELPTFVLDAAREWSIAGAVVRGADYVNGPFGNSLSASSASPGDITTSGTNSTIVHLYSLERRAILGISTGSGRSNQVFYGSVSTGTAEGHDNATGVAADFEPGSGTAVPSPSWSITGVGDDRANIIEILDNGAGETPVYLRGTIFTELTGYSVGTDGTWRDAIVDAGVVLDKQTQAVYSFDASDVDTANDYINMSNHGIPHSRVVRANANGNALPTGVVDGNYYFVDANNNDKIRLRDANSETVAAGDWFSNNTADKPTVSITGAGSGTCEFIDVGLQWVEMNTTGALDRPPSKHYSGAANMYGDGITFSTPKDLSNDVVSLKVGSTSANQTVTSAVILMVDSTGGWKAWQAYDNDANRVGTAREMMQIELDFDVYLAKSATFNSQAIKNIIYLMKAPSWNAKPTLHGFDLPLSTISKASVVGGSPDRQLTWEMVADYLSLVDPALASVPSKNFIVTLGANVQLGSGEDAHNIYFTDSEKTVGFPPSADGVSSMKTYVSELGLSMHPASDSNITVNTTQVGASAVFPLTVNGINPGGQLSMDGSTIVKGTVTLDSTQTVKNVQFIGGKGISHNDATIQNCTFNKIDRASGFVLLTTAHNISDVVFKADSTSDFALEIDTAGSYTISGFKFDGFAASLNPTHTAGTVTVNVSGGDAPTLDGSWTDEGDGLYSKGSVFTQINAGATLSISGLVDNTEVRFYESGTVNELHGVEASAGGTVSFVYTTVGLDVDVVIHHVQYKPIRLTNLTLASTDSTIPVQQQFDRNYKNP